MPHALVALAMLALATPALAAETCPPIERIPGPAVYVILHGYRHATAANVKPARMVNRDMTNMTAFFRALGPRQLHAHAEDMGVMHHWLGDDFRPATWRALLGSVDRVIRDIDNTEHAIRPRVYVYFAGHGTIGERDRLDLFTGPEEGAESPGYNGELDAQLIAERITRPLAQRADVHLIVDTCHSYHLMQTRSAYTRDKLSPQPPLEVAYAHDFAAEHSGVGALLAARGLTREEPNYGGLFSHLVRSMAVGVADLNRDGVITYGEMSHALPQASEDVAPIPEPVIVPPGLDADRPFIDWRSTPAAHVCFPSDVPGTRLLLSRHGIFATVQLPDAPRAYWLPAGETFGLDTWGDDARYFRAETGPLRYTTSPTRIPEGPLTAGGPPIGHESGRPLDGATASSGAEAWEPFPGMLRDEIRPADAEAAVTPLGPRYSAGVGALIGGALVY